MTDKNTRDKIINSGIKLFALNGYHNTSIREITKDANSNIASINYHFGSKRNLIKSIIEEIMGPLNQARLKKLEELLKIHKNNQTKPSTKDIIKIFIGPALQSITSGEEGFLRHQLLVRINTSADDEIKLFFQDFMKDIFKNFLKALAIANPDKPEEELTAKLFFSIGSLHHSVFLMNNQFPFKGLEIKKISPEKNIDVLVNYITGGIKS